MKIVIVGGVAGGATAAVRARCLDEHAQITILERGAFVSFANCGLPYHLGGVIPKREHLILLEPEFLAERFKIDVRINHQVMKINRKDRTVEVMDKTQHKMVQISYDKLIISTGASPVSPAIEGVDNPNVCHLWTLPDMDKIMLKIKNKQQVTLVGAGFVGLEIAENLIERGLDVTLIEFLDQVLPTIDKEMTADLRGVLQEKGCKIRLSTALKSIQQEGDFLKLNFTDGTTAQTQLLLLSTGVRPNSELAQSAQLPCNARGAIIVDEYMQTADEHIYAVGDVVEVRDPILGGKIQVQLAAPANKQARIAVENAIFGNSKIYVGSFGASVIKLFNLNVAMVGWNEKMLKKNNQTYEKIYLHPFDHVPYYPGAWQLHLKVIFDPQTQKILGAQCVGKGDVARRIDVISTAMHAGLTVGDLGSLELCYAPPFGAPKDAVNHVGVMAQNLLEKRAKIAHFDSIMLDDFILDVRDPEETIKGALPHCMNIPLNQLRQQLTQLPKNRRILIYCLSGVRGYYAERILTQNGFNAYNLSGGYMTYQMLQSTL